jgi:Fe-S oxidoreductase
MIREDCLEKEDAFCTSECPFHLDVREFVKKVSRGSFNSAYRMYANAVGFPAIVSELCERPCEGACPRRDLDGAVALRMLEAASVRYASNTKPNNYNLPAKEGRIAIVGGGPGGLACALRLANKKYRVTICDMSSKLGGGLPRAMDPGVVLRELELQFMYESYSFVPDLEVTDIEAFASSYDAVYISTGNGGADFGFSGEGPFPMATRLPGVFIGEETAGASPVRRIACGLRAATVIESYIKTGVMKGAAAVPHTRMILDPEALRHSPPVAPLDGELYSKEEAAREASRCVRCRCDACVRHCGLMAYYSKFPKRLEEEIEATINPGTLDGNGTIVTRFISTCNQCGLCGTICPKGIDIGEVLRASHEALSEKGAMPWAFHEFWLRDMDSAYAERSSLAAPPPRRERAGSVFFPGCQLGASNPEYVTEAYRYILDKKPDTGIALMCCGAPAAWAADGAKHSESVRAIREAFDRLGSSEAILACPTCMDMFARYLPGIKTVLLYDVMALWGVPAVQGGGTVSVFDPCSARHKPLTRLSVRKILVESGHELEPLPYEGARAQCCSWGGQISTTAPNYSKWLVNNRVSEGDKPYVVYCSNCRDIFAGSGKPAKHILDVLFGLGDWTRRPPTQSERRRNRVFLKRALLREYWQGTEQGDEENMRRLVINGDLREKLDRNRMLEEDVLSTIESCEKSGRVIIDTQTSRRFGHGAVGSMTYWVEYSLTEDGYELTNAYSHRMAIEMEDIGNGRKDA